MESKCCEKCLRCPDYPDSGGHNYCHDSNCPCHAPKEEEWEGVLYFEVMEDLLFLAKMTHHAKDPSAHMEESRDAYQKLVRFIKENFIPKERVEKVIAKEKEANKELIFFLREHRDAVLEKVESLLFEDK